MNTLKKVLVLFSLTTLTAGFSAVAQAEYNLKAFGETLGYSEILSGDAAGAASVFENRSTRKMDFMELNNLCVSQIMVGEHVAAIASCETALKRVNRNRSVSLRDKRISRANIYSNLAVAKINIGDMTGATSDFSTAVSFNSQDNSINANQDLLTINVLVGGR